MCRSLSSRPTYLAEREAARPDAELDVAAAPAPRALVARDPCGRGRRCCVRGRDVRDFAAARCIQPGAIGKIGDVHPKMAAHRRWRQEPPDVHARGGGEAQLARHGRVGGLPRWRVRHHRIHPEPPGWRGQDHDRSRAVRRAVLGPLSAARGGELGQRRGRGASAKGPRRGDPRPAADRLARPEGAGRGGGGRQEARRCGRPLRQRARAPPRAPDAVNHSVLGGDAGAAARRLVHHPVRPLLQA